MAILNRLPTLDRLLSWDIEIEDNYLLCQNELKTKDHLFFGCDYSKGIWQRILTLSGVIRETGSWAEELAWAESHLKGKSMRSIVLRLAWKAFIYHVWRERNSRKNNQNSQSSTQIFEQIKGIICIKIAELKSAT